MKKTILDGYEKMLSHLIPLKEHSTLYNHWCWDLGVAFYGFIQLYEKTHDERLYDTIIEWMNYNEENRRIGSINEVCLANTELFLYAKTKDIKHKNIADEYVSYCKNDVILAPNGAFAHVIPECGEDNQNQLWADTVYMSVLFMQNYGNQFHDKELIDSARKQLDLHLSSLYDSDAKMFNHGYHCLFGERIGQHWGRGNGWIAAALPDFIERELEAGRDITKYIDIYKEFMASVKEKSENGKIHTLIDCPDSYLETTATSLFGYSALKGYRLGILGSEYRNWGMKALSALLSDLDECGVIMHASSGTNCGDKESYYNIKFEARAYAYGIAFMHIAEALKEIDNPMETNYEI